AVVARATAESEAGKNGRIRYGSVQKLTVGVVFLSFFREYRHVAVENFENMIGTDGKAQIDAPAAFCKSEAEGIEAGEERRRRALTLRYLFDCCLGGANFRCDRRRRDRRGSTRTCSAWASVGSQSGAQSFARSFNRPLPFSRAIHCRMNHNGFPG